jgi:threonine/homoserine/homoserine lactone efflux protein
MIAAALAVVALLVALGIAACGPTTSLAQDAVQTCGKGNVAYVDINSQQFGCRR